MELSQEMLLAIGGALGAAVILQLGLALYLIASLRTANRDREQASREIFGLLKRLEGLTADRRERMVKHYDKILEGLTARIPTTVAAQASNLILETESKILARLAELEPNLKDDEGSRKKMDELITTMEKLERTLVSSAADTVQKAMAEGRRSLFEEESIDMRDAA
jgi:hypothetical protein